VVTPEQRATVEAYLDSYEDVDALWTLASRGSPA